MWDFQLGWGLQRSGYVAVSFYIKAKDGISLFDRLNSMNYFSLQLFADVAPLISENFRALCTGNLYFTYFFGKLIQIHLFVSVTCKWLFVIATIVRYLNASSHVYILCHLGHYEIWNVIVNQVIWFIDLDFVIVNASIKNTEAFVKKYFKLFNCTIIVVNSQNYLLILNY